MSLLLAALGFLSGSVLYSAVLPRFLKGIDICKLAPDHNPGAANAFKYGGVPIGIFALICDLLKAYLPVRLACNVVGLQSPAFALILCAPILGHAFSPFAHWKGGKAIASSFGAFLAIFPVSRIVMHLAFWYILFSTLILIRPHSIRTIIAFGLTALAAFRQPLFSVAIGTFIIFATVSGRHISSLHSSAFSLHLLSYQLWPRTSKEESTITDT